MNEHGLIVNTTKNRDRDDYSFANINLLGKCNVHCFFCLGLDLEEELKGQDQRATEFLEWPNFRTFLDQCKVADIKKLYITGQNTDSLLYKHLSHLIRYLRSDGFEVGLRTNGYRAQNMMDVINMCDLRIGYSIHSLSPVTNNMIMGRSDIPDWDRILEKTQNSRVSIVLNRYNKSEFFRLVKYIAQFPKVKYIQVRKVSTETRKEELAPDMAAFEAIYSLVKEMAPLVKKFVTDAEVYNIYGKEVVFWRTVKTSANSMNYFTDGTISPEYFIVEGYLKHCRSGLPMANVDGLVPQPPDGVLG